MENDKEKNSHPSRMEQDVKNTSRTMKPGKEQEGSTSIPKGQGRGWHGDSEGHAKAGSQSHKKSDDKQA